MASPEDQLWPVPVAVAVATIVPSAVVPSKISTVTSVASLAVPENAGVVSLEGMAVPQRHGGRFRVDDERDRGAVSRRMLPISLACVASAVNVCPAGGQLRVDVAGCPGARDCPAR